MNTLIQGLGSNHDTAQATTLGQCERIRREIEHIVFFLQSLYGHGFWDFAPEVPKLIIQDLQRRREMAEKRKAKERRAASRAAT